MQNFSDRQVIAAFFRNQTSAENAIDELRRSGFKANQIGCSYDSPANTDIKGSNTRTDVSDTEHDRSFWQKVEGFFTGDEGYEDRNTGAEDGRYNEGNVVGRTLNIPDRYRDRLNAGGCIVTVHESTRINEAEQILTRNGGEIDRQFATERPSTVASGAEPKSGVENLTGERRIRLVSEMLRVNKERVSAGEVRLRKEVRTETQNVEVPVTHEELVVERVPVEGRAATDANIGEEEIRVPLSEERVVVDKTPVVREEVRVGKRAVQDTEKVSDQVRHEDLKVDDQTKKVRQDPKRKKTA